MIGGFVTVVGGPKAQAKQFRPFLKEVLQDTVEFWHERFLPRHFERSAYGRYHYARRTAAHERRKLRLFGHRDPLVFTGRMRREVSGMIRLSGTAHKATGSMKGPPYLYQFVVYGKKVDKAAELRKTTRQEEREMGRFLDRFLEKKLNSIQTTETRRI